jgi:hypothetical protein
MVSREVYEEVKGEILRDERRKVRFEMVMGVEVSEGVVEKYVIEVEDVRGIEFGSVDVMMSRMGSKLRGVCKEV